MIHDRNSRPCAIRYCNNRTERRIHRLCGKHRSTNRRHGHPEQKMLRKTDYKPTAEKLKAMFRSDPQLLEGIEMVYSFVLQELEAEAETLKVGACIRHGRIANERLLKVFRENTAVDVAATVSAIYVLREVSPNLFKSDDAFLFQVVHAVLKLSPCSQGVTLNKNGKATGWYRHPTTRVMRRLAERTITPYNRLGSHVMRLHRQHNERYLRANEKIDEGFLQLAGS